MADVDLNEMGQVLIRTAQSIASRLCKDGRVLGRVALQSDIALANLTLATIARAAGLASDGRQEPK